MRGVSRRPWARPVVEEASRKRGRRLRVAAKLALLAFCALCGNASDAAAQTHTVVIKGFKFNPAALTVHRGDRIVWRNKDLVPHTATSQRVLDSRSIAPGQLMNLRRAKGGYAEVWLYLPSDHAGNADSGVT